MTTDNLTALLARSVAGDRKARDLVYQTSFSRLRRIAASLLARESRSDTPEATALVNEAYASRLHGLRVSPKSREHFFGMAARAMRQVLIDQGRISRAVKNTRPRAGSVEGEAAASMSREAELALGVALERLAEVDPVAAETIRLRYAEGYTQIEVASMQNRDSWRVAADCEFGLSWMRGQLG